MTSIAYKQTSPSPMTNLDTPSVGVWFDAFVNGLRQQQQEIELNVAGGETVQLFKILMSGNIDELLLSNLQNAQRYFLSKMTTEYLELVKQLPILQLAFSAQGYTLFVWAKIADNDDETEKNLIRAGSIILGTYGNKGFILKDTIVEASENLSIPKTYTIFKND